MSQPKGASQNAMWHFHVFTNVCLAFTCLVLVKETYGTTDEVNQFNIKGQP